MPAWLRMAIYLPGISFLQPASIRRLPVDERPPTSYFQRNPFFHPERQKKIVQNADPDPASAKNFRSAIHFVQHIDDDQHSGQGREEMPQPIAAAVPEKIMVYHRDMQE